MSSQIGKPSPAMDRLDPPEILAIKSRQVDYAKPIPGTYLTTGMRAARGFRLGKFCRSLMVPANREAFKADGEGYMRSCGLDDFEQHLVRTNDWNGMVRYGVNCFAIFKLASTFGVGQNRTGAGMRKQSYEDFMATRNVPGAS